MLCPGGNYGKYIEPFTMIYRRRVGAYGIENKELMEAFKAWVKEEGLKGDILCLALDDPLTTLPSQCRYDVGIKVESTMLENHRVFEAGKYRIMEIDHTEEAIAMVYQNLGEFDQSRPIVEYYREASIALGKCEVWIPIV